VRPRGETPFRSLPELWRRAGVTRAALDRLAEADAFRPSLKLARREALWTIKGLRDAPLPLFDPGEDTVELDEAPVALKPMTDGREVVEDYQTLGLSLRAHPVSFPRPELSREASSPAPTPAAHAMAASSRPPAWCRCASALALPRA
jgi:error-prone DNA polymerase